MTKSDAETGGQTSAEALTLNEAHQLICELHRRQAELETQNHVLKRELEARRVQTQYEPAPQELPFAGMDRRKPVHSANSPGKGLLRCIIDSVDDLIYVKDRDGVYLGCNKASEIFVGIKESEQIGKTDFDFFEHELAKTVQAIDQQVLTSGQAYSVEEWVPSPDGSRSLLETQKKPFYGLDGEALGIVGISRDITERKREEETLKKINQELEAFAHTVAHDLRTQLIPIIGYAELLRGKYSEALDDQARPFLDEIISAGENMLLLMKDLLALAVSGHIERPSVPLYVGDVATAVVSKFTEQLSQAGVSVKVGTLPQLLVPRTLLIQIYSNLILNAMKYGCKAGDIIEVGGERDKDHVKLYVRDHGPGIPLNERERIFEVFYRGETTADKPGTGIGLATVQKIATLLGGRAWVDETPGGGSTFWIDIVDVLVDDAGV